MKSPIAIVSEHVDLTTLAATINVEHATAGQHLSKALEHARRAGDALLRAKDSLPHGRFIPWLKSHFQFSERTARNYMLVARNWQAIESTDAGSVRDAVRMLTAVDSDHDPEIGNALPFCLPPVGQMVLGIVAIGVDPLDWIVVVVESDGEHWIRTAVAGDELSYDKRGWHRDYFDIWLEYQKFEPEFLAAIHWFSPRPVKPENNPLRYLIPEWKYEVPA